MSPRIPAWRPGDEAEAASNMAQFVEWLRASGQAPQAGPALVRGWAARDRLGLHEAVADCLGLADGASLRAAMPGGARLALARPDGRWSRDRLRAEWPGLPEIRGSALAALACSHLLGQELRPDDALRWDGDPAEPWPYAALLIGASVWLGVAAPAGARRCAARPVTWAD